jgi:serine/threonine protein kinase/tetratricopeptide (TPR) repeat protein
MDRVSHPTPDGIAGKRFRLVRRLGEGGMGVVYEALDTERNARVALKTVRTMTAESLARFKREFRAVQDVHHPNLATIGELVSEADRLFFTMELVEGTDFIGHVCPDVSSFGDDAPSSEQASTRALGFASTRRIALGPLERPPRFDDRRLRAAMAQLAQGLVALHEAGLVHRDIKPSNIRVTGEGRVVLLDFGLVSDVSSNRDTTDHNVVGTPAYMAPEQAASKPVGPAADWYSVGILLYEVFTGSPPFEGPPLEVLLRKQQREPPAPSTLSRHVPTDLDELCTALLRFDPEARPTGAQVLRMLGVPVASPAMRSHSQTANFPFVGRAPELDTLADAYGDSRRGAVSVLIRGESGVGKSCLVKRFVDVLSLEQNDLVVLSGRCYEREAVPYKALDGIVDALTRFLKRLPAAECSGLTPTKPGPLVQLFPVLRRVGAIASQTKNMAPPVLDPLELRSRAFAALREMLTRLADRRALVLVIDDLQWAGADSLALLADVLRPPEAPNVLLVATVRTSGGDAPRDALLPGDVRSVDLGRLSPQQALELTTLLLQRAGTASAADADAIVAEAEGHPLFIDALVRHAMLDEGEKLGTVYLEEALWSRVRLLEVPTRRLMELLACAGAPIEQDVLSAASDSDRDDFAQQIAFLRVAHLASISGGRGSDTIEPYHDKVRAAVVANLDEATRRDCHRRLAIALETSTRADPEALASHWQRAGEPVRGAKYAIRAAEQASESLAFDRAANLYALALELTPREDPERRALSEKLGEAFGNAGRGALAAAAYRDAAQGASAAHALDLRRRAAEQLLRGGHFEEGMTAIGEVLASIGLALPSSPFAALMWLLLWRLYLRIRGLRFRERDPGQVTANELTRSDVCWSVANAMSFADHIVGAAYQGRAVVLALRSGDPYRIARALALEIGYVGAGGGPSWRRTQSLIRHAKTLAESSGRPDAIAWVEGATGLAFQLVGRYPESLRHLARSREIILGQCSGMAWEIDTLQYLELNDLTYMGEIAELCRLAPKYLRDAIDRGDRYGALNMSTGAPNIRWLVVDDPAAARNEVAEAMRKWPSQGFHVEHFNEFVALTLADVYADRAGDAYQRFVERWPALVRSQLLRVQAIAIVLHHMRALAAIARAERGSEPRSPLLMVAARDARAILRTKMPLAVVVGNLVLAGVEVVRGARGRERAVAALREAMRVGDDHSMHLWSTPARRSLGLLLGGDEGAELVRSADARLAAQGVKHPERMCTAFAPGFSRLM